MPRYRDFHEATTYHSREDGEFAMGPDRQDAIWEQDMSIEPYPYKVYTGLPPIELTGDVPPGTALDGLAALTPSVAGDSGAPPARPPLDRASLARIGLLSVGLLGRNRTIQRADGSIREVQYRTAGATGARYHLELYFVCGDLPDLAAGVYQYSAIDHTLRRLRAGDHRPVVVEATGSEPATAHAPVVLAVTSTFWRNAWRYKARAYRHAHWDAGTSLSQAMAAAASAGLRSRLVMGFADERVNALLGIDGRREAAIALATIGVDDDSSPAEPRAATGTSELKALDLSTRPISASEVTFDDIPTFHAATELRTGTDAAGWRAAELPDADTPEEGAPPVRESTALEPLDPQAFPTRSVDDLVLARRSTRHYDRDTPVPFGAFSTLLDVASRPIDADVPRLVETYLIVNRVERLMPGLYRHRPDLGVVELLRAGDARADAQRITGDQWYVGDAHVSVYFLADMERVYARFGDRGYRAAQVQSALAAGRLHLAGHALGLGACGSTAFDEEVIALFGPSAARLTYMFVVVFGVPRRRNRAGA